MRKNDGGGTAYTLPVANVRQNRHRSKQEVEFECLSRIQKENSLELSDRIRLFISVKSALSELIGALSDQITVQNR